MNEVTEVVHFERHLGNKLYYNIFYLHDMKGLIIDFYLSNNLVIANFNMCDSVTLNNIYSTYCSSLHGIELFNFSGSHMPNLYIAWRSYKMLNIKGIIYFLGLLDLNCLVLALYQLKTIDISYINISLDFSFRLLYRYW